jgi:hypothetical protein
MKSDRVPNFPADYNQIATIIARYRASGLGLKAFARKEGLPPGRLHYWIYQKPAGVTKRGLILPSLAPTVPAFQEIELPSRPEGGGGWAAEVGLPGGVAIRFRAGASAEWIGSVVQALQRPC